MGSNTCLYLLECAIFAYLFPLEDMLICFCMTKSIIHYKINAMLKFHLAIDLNICDPALQIILLPYLNHSFVSFHLIHLLRFNSFTYFWYQVKKVTWQTRKVSNKSAVQSSLSFGVMALNIHEIVGDPCTIMNVS